MELRAHVDRLKKQRSQMWMNVVEGEKNNQDVYLFAAIVRKTRLGPRLKKERSTTNQRAELSRQRPESRCGSPMLRCGSSLSSLSRVTTQSRFASRGE